MHILFCNEYNAIKEHGNEIIITSNENYNSKNIVTTSY